VTLRCQWDVGVGDGDPGPRANEQLRGIFFVSSILTGLSVIFFFQSLYTGIMPPYCRLSHKRVVLFLLFLMSTGHVSRHFHLKGLAQAEP
jgi:uncharacterized membrane protein